MGVNLLAVLLLSCGIAAVATWLIFLESWFTVSARNRFVVRRASGAYGVVSVFLTMRGSVESVERTIRSVLAQSYPFIELFLISSEDNPRHGRLAQEFRNMRSHVRVRWIQIPNSLENVHNRIRALEQAQSSAKGRWYAIVDAGLILERLAIEGSLEFAGTGEVSALALRPGVQCRSLLQRLFIPSMEYLLQLLWIVERRRERSKKINVDSPYLLMNREAFELVNRINRMPGILNESGWSIWSYQVEGLRTWEGDGSRWLWREVGVSSWAAYAETEHGYTRRSAALIAASTVISFIPVLGLAYCLALPIATLVEASIFGFSIISYALMTISYYLHARRVHAASWFAPLWFLAHAPASVITLIGIRRSADGDPVRQTEQVNQAGKV